MPLRERPAAAQDRAALLALFAVARPDLALLPAALLAQQFDVQQAHYRMQFPQLDDRVLLDGELVVGRLRVARGAEEIRLVDIALVPSSRGQGHGAALIAALQAEARATQRPLRLQVADGNPAARLYARLGFREIGMAPPYRLLEWRGV